MQRAVVEQQKRLVAGANCAKLNYPDHTFANRAVNFVPRSSTTPMSRLDILPFFLFLSLTRSLTNPPLFLFVAFFSFFSLFFLSIGSKPIDRDAFSMRAPSILPVIDNVFVIQLQPRAAGQREIRSARKNDWRKMPCFSRVEITSVL